jgi:hypothetical protein
MEKVKVKKKSLMIMLKGVLTAYLQNMKNGNHQLNGHLEITLQLLMMAN